MTRDRPSIVEFVRDPQLLNLALSLPEEALLRLIYGLALSDAQAEVARACTGRERLPTNGASNVTVVAGARAGKDSRVAGPVACFEALFGGHERHLGKGEVGIVALVLLFAITVTYFHAAARCGRRASLASSRARSRRVKVH